MNDMIEILSDPVSGFLFFSFLGLIFGSFSNVIIVRLPKGQSISWPGSHCLKCKKKVLWYDNIPLISWLILLGKCRSCKTKISVRYPTIELLCGALFGALFLKMGLSWSLVEYLILGFGLITVSAIDLEHMILPDKFTLSGIVLGLTGAWLNPERFFLDSLLGVLIGGGFLYLIALVYFLARKTEGLGGGDIKLIAWLGAYLGWTSIPFILFTSSVLGSLIGILVGFKSSMGMKYAIPFGPFLAGSGLLYLFFFEEIMNYYNQLVFLGYSPLN